MRAGDDPRQLGVVAGLDVDQPGVGRPDDVGQEGPLGRVEDALGGERRVEAEDDDDAAEHVGHLHQPMLVDDRVDLDLGQVVDRPGLDGRQHAPWTSGRGGGAGRGS